MLRIVVTSGAEKGRSLDSNDMKYIEIGRQAQHLRLTDPRVSRVHCSLEKVDDGNWFLMDKNSKHGTQRNGQRVMRRTLISDGDRINIGHTVIRCFISKPMVAADPAPAQKPAPKAKRQVQSPPRKADARRSPEATTPQAEPKPRKQTHVKPQQTSSKSGSSGSEAAADCWFDAVKSEIIAFEEEEQADGDDESKD